MHAGISVCTRLIILRLQDFTLIIAAAALSSLSGTPASGTLSAWSARAHALISVSCETVEMSVFLCEHLSGSAQRTHVAGTHQSRVACHFLAFLSSLL